MINTQRPFAYQERERRLDRRLRRMPPIRELSANIHGICITCGNRFQKVFKEKLWAKNKNGDFKLSPEGKKICIGISNKIEPCKRCILRGLIGTVMEFPKSMLPWKVNDGPNSPFICGLCGLRFYSYCVLGSMCSHKKHALKSTCRFCCSKVEKKEENKPLSVSSDLSDGEMFYRDFLYAPTEQQVNNTYSHILTRWAQANDITIDTQINPMFTSDDFDYEEDY